VNELSSLTRQNIITYACKGPMFVLAGDAVVPAVFEPMMVILALLELAMVVGPVFETGIVVLLSVLAMAMVVLPVLYEEIVVITL